MVGSANGVGTRVDPFLSGPFVVDDAPRHLRRVHSRSSVTSFTELSRDRATGLSTSQSTPDLRSLGNNAVVSTKTSFSPPSLDSSKTGLLSPKLPVVKETKTGDCTHHPSRGWKWLPHHLSEEELWLKIRDEAKADAETEASLASVLHSAILVHRSFEKTMAFILANKLATPTLLGTHLMRLILDAYEDDPDLLNACSADIQAVYERDPACDKYLQCLLYFKGFHAIQSHRVANWLWKKGRKSLALAIQSRISECFHVDIHPGAELGRGLMIDHATGVVIGETAIIEDNVAMLHHVTLGGSGTGVGKRHPTIGAGVLLGAGAIVLGPVTVGAGTKVGAGTVVVRDLPCYAVAVGVPARIVKQDKSCEPCVNMDQCSDFILDFQI